MNGPDMNTPEFHRQANDAFALFDELCDLRTDRDGPSLVVHFDGSWCLSALEHTGAMIQKRIELEGELVSYMVPERRLAHLARAADLDSLARTSRTLAEVRGWNNATGPDTTPDPDEWAPQVTFNSFHSSSYDTASNDRSSSAATSEAYSPYVTLDERAHDVVIPWSDPWPESVTCHNCKGIGAFDHGCLCSRPESFRDDCTTCRGTRTARTACPICHGAGKLRSSVTWCFTNEMDGASLSVVVSPSTVPLHRVARNGQVRYVLDPSQLCELAARAVCDEPEVIWRRDGQLVDPEWFASRWEVPTDGFDPDEQPEALFAAAAETLRRNTAVADRGERAVVQISLAPARPARMLCEDLASVADSHGSVIAFHRGRSLGEEATRCVSVVSNSSDGIALTQIGTAHDWRLAAEQAWQALTR